MKLRLTFHVERRPYLLVLSEYMREDVQGFFVEVHEAFSFLEEEYLYHPPLDIFDEKMDWRYLQANVIYLSRTIAVNIIWHLTLPTIDVGFVELVMPYYVQTLPGLDPGPGQSISLQIYAEMLGNADDPDFLLKHPTASKSYVRQNEQKIRAKRQIVITGLARATRRYAGSILLGDTSMFSKVSKYTHDR